MTYPFDPEVRRAVTGMLYGLLPSLYRVRDLPEGRTEPLGIAAGPGEEELYKFIHVLAAPLAELRQNIDELHADLFIDKCADWVLPHLAKMIGSRLVFPDAGSNRKDVRGTVGWRRRKGTPAMLQEMASDLLGQMVVTQEGWKRLLLSQDLNLLRLERTIGELAPARIAEEASGPLDASFHALDPRRISARTGRYHPKHVAHWTHPTELFPLREGTPFDRTPPGVDDLRYQFLPVADPGELRRTEKQLRIRRAAPEDRSPPTDRVPPMHFAARPGDYFDQTGISSARFTVRIDGLAAAVAAPELQPRTVSNLPADAALAAESVSVVLLQRTLERLAVDFEVEVHAVPLIGPAVDTSLSATRGGVVVDRAGTGAALPPGAVPVPSPWLPMLRIRPAGGGAAYFPGATIEIANAVVGARLPSSDAVLAEQGFLRGALAVDVPATWVHDTRWLYLSADGSVFESQSVAVMQVGGDSDLALTVTGAGLRLPGNALAIGPGPAWPPLPASAEPGRWRAVPGAVARGPVVIHGAPLLVDLGGGAYGALGAAVSCALVFAARARDTFEPFLRLEWSGDDATAAATFQVLDSAGAALLTTTAIQARAAAIAAFAENEGQALEMLVRLEADDAATVLPPCEVSYTSADGRVVLAHLPMLQTGPNPVGQWPAGLATASVALSVGEDGSAWVMNEQSVARWAYGPIAPIREALSHRRRRVRQRSLCPWDNEDIPGGVIHAPVPPGFLDIDPLHGLFALAASEPAPPFTASAVEVTAVPRPLTVDYQEGYSAHVGARPDAREPLLDLQQALPTRIVLGAGRFHAGAGSAWHALPRYATLSDALAAIAADPSPAAHEVVQIEDSATYAEPSLTWPANVESLTVQAAEFERPVLMLLADWTAAALPAYVSLTLRGLTLSQTVFALEAPRALRIDVQLCTVLGATELWRFATAPTQRSRVELVRCVTGRLESADDLEVVLRDTVVDAAGGQAIAMPEATVEMERVTVAANREDLGGGPAVVVLVLEASEVIFDEVVVALDQFRGCIRYSRVEVGSKLPRRHHVVDVERNASGLVVPDALGNPVPIRPSFVTRDRNDPAHLRLSDRCRREIARGAEDGSEMGAFHGVRLAQRTEAVVRRLFDFTPAGLATGLIRLD